jgi:hypothetical protein
MGRLDNRAVAPVVGKTLAAGIALLYVAGMLIVLLNGQAPAYRTAAGAELGERALATAADGIERALPDAEGHVQTRREVALPATIRDAGYALRLRNGTLALDHPTGAVDGQASLSLPGNVTVADGRWESGETLVVRVAGPPANRTLWLEDG